MQILSKFFKTDNKEFSENKDKIANTIFDICSTNKFLSEIYSELYVELVGYDDIFGNLLDSYIDKYKGYQKKTGQQSALLVAHGKIGGLKAVAIGYNFAFGGAAFSQRENEHFLTEKVYFFYLHITFDFLIYFFENEKS